MGAVTDQPRLLAYNSYNNNAWVCQIGAFAAKVATSTVFDEAQSTTLLVLVLYMKRRNFLCLYLITNVYATEAHGIFKINCVAKTLRSSFLLSNIQ